MQVSETTLYDLLVLLSMILWYFLPVKCQTRFVQVPLLTTEAGARSLWCGSFRYVGFVSKQRFCHGTDLSLYVLGFLANRLSVCGL